MNSTMTIENLFEIPADLPMVTLPPVADLRDRWDDQAPGGDRLAGEVKRAAAGWDAIRTRDLQNLEVFGDGLYTRRGCFTGRSVLWNGEDVLYVSGRDGSEFLLAVGLDGGHVRALVEKHLEKRLWDLLEANPRAATRSGWERDEQTWGAYTHIMFRSDKYKDGRWIG